jgi:hypothetical protein
MASDENELPLHTFIPTRLAWCTLVWTNPILRRPWYNTRLDSCIGDAYGRRPPWIPRHLRNLPRRVRTTTCVVKEILRRPGWLATLTQLYARVCEYEGRFGFTLV